MRIAVVHEWLTARAGSEKVFERLARIYPSADLFSLLKDPHVQLDTLGREITTTALDRARIRKYRSVTLPAMPLAWWALRRGNSYDIVVSSAHAFAREFFDVRRDGAHYCYVHAPMRYAWDRGLDPRTSNVLAAPAAALLRRFDLRSVPHVHSFAANSSETQRRLREYYGVDAEIIHPPVSVDFFQGVEREPQGYLFAFGRFIEYKRFDLAIDVADALGMPLIIAGSGPLEQSLRVRAERARTRVEIRLRPSDEELRQLLGGAEALLFPGIEDFGIVPVEAQAAGVPVVGPRRGGLLDTVRDGETGMLAAEQSVESLTQATRALLGEQLGGAACSAWASKFAPEVFDERVRDWVSV